MRKQHTFAFNADAASVDFVPALMNQGAAEKRQTRPAERERLGPSPPSSGEQSAREEPMAGRSQSPVCRLEDSRWKMTTTAREPAGADSRDPLRTH